MLILTSCGTINVYHFKNDKFYNRRKRNDTIYINYVNASIISIPTAETQFCNKNIVNEVLSNAYFSIERRAENRNIYLGEYPKSLNRLELTNLSFNETINKVELRDSQDKSLGLYNSYNITFTITGNLILDNETIPISEKFEITSYPRQSRLFKFGVVNSPSYIDEKKVIENLENRFVNEIYRTILRTRKKTKT